MKLEDWIAQFPRGLRSVAFDVGANRGGTTQYLARHFELIYAFEPDPTSREILQRDFPQSNVLIHSAALGDRDAPVALHRDLRPGKNGIASSCNSLDDLAGTTETLMVACWKIDTLCALFGLRPNFINVDVEGFEPNVLDGARDVIAMWRPIIRIKFWESWLHRGFLDVFRLLSVFYRLSVEETGQEIKEYLSDSARDRWGTKFIRAVPHQRGVLEPSFHIERVNRPLL